MRSLICINQYTTQLFADVVNELSRHAPGVRLISGRIEDLESPLSERVSRTRFVSYRREQPWLRVITWAVFSLQTFFYLLFIPRPLALLVTSNPPMMPFLAALIGYICRAPLFLVIYDVYPEALVNFGRLRRGGLIHRLWEFCNRHAFRRAEAVFTISQSLCRSLAGYIPRDRQSDLHIVPCWVDSDFIRPLDKASNGFLKNHELQGYFIVLYSGNLGATHDINSILQLAGILRDYEKIMFLIIGSGAQQTMVADYTRQHRPPNLMLLPRQPAAMIPLTFGAADIGIVTLGQGAEMLSVPSKTYYYLAAGAPVLAISDKGSELENLVQECRVGEVFNPGEYRKMADFVLDLYLNPDRRTEISHRARNMALLHTKANAAAFYSTISEKLPTLRSDRYTAIVPHQ